MANCLIRNVLAVIYLIAVFAICLMIVFENRNPVKTLSWMLVILFVPVAGMIVYFFFGRNYRKQKIYTRKSLADSARLKIMPTARSGFSHHTWRVRVRRSGQRSTLYT
jgi:cardiolipin synthase A/B